VYISAFRHGAWKQLTWVGAPVSVHGFSLMDPLNCSMDMRISCMSCANRYISNQSIGMSTIGHAQIRSDQIMSVPSKNSRINIDRTPYLHFITNFVITLINMRTIASFSTVAVCTPGVGSAKATAPRLVRRPALSAVAKKNAGFLHTFSRFERFVFPTDQCVGDLCCLTTGSLVASVN